ncbi:MAG: DUF4286 family protein [Saprospiraceae bacterium]|nr:DUF4286 family protein [Saprospiraceae bacterium]
MMTNTVLDLRYNAAPDDDTFDRYQTNFAKALQKEHADKYQNKYVAFRTLMQIESEG